jgi:hypothetical protein
MINMPTTALVRSTIKSPEEQELEDKRRLIDELETEFATLQLEYSTLAGEIGTFRNRYYLRVGALYARLDILRAEIREIEARLNPEDDAAQAAAEEAREQAEATCDEVNEAVEDDPVAFEPSAELKQLYRQAAKLIHPDRARDEDDRQLRDRLMAAINVAYGKGETNAIGELIEQYREQLNAADTDDIGSQLVRAIRSIARTRDRINGLISSIDDLKNSEWAKLKAEVEEGEARGDDPLGDLTEKIHRDIIEAQEKISSLLTKTTDTPAEALSEQSELHPTAKAPPDGPATDTATPMPEPHKTEGVFRPEGLIHRTERGEKVRSKSEAIIANILHGLGLDYRYEYPIEGKTTPGIRRPDFVVFDAEHRPILWEHLGMLSNESYRNKWNAKLAWYEANGFTQGVDLFITRDDPDGALDSQRLRKTADYIRSLVTP